MGGAPEEAVPNAGKAGGLRPARESSALKAAASFSASFENMAE
jgi:hypothetical protein